MSQLVLIVGHNLPPPSRGQDDKAFFQPCSKTELRGTKKHGVVAVASCPPITWGLCLSSGVSGHTACQCLFREEPGAESAWARQPACWEPSSFSWVSEACGTGVDFTLNWQGCHHEWKTGWALACWSSVPKARLCLYGKIAFLTLTGQRVMLLSVSFPLQLTQGLGQGEQERVMWQKELWAWDLDTCSFKLGSFADKLQQTS